MKKTTKNRSKKINVYNVYNAAGDNEEVAEKLLRRRGGGGSSRNYDDFAEEDGEVDYATENITKDDDEEITEDDAFDDEDEDKYGLFFTTRSFNDKESKKSKKKSKSPKELTLSEDSDSSGESEDIDDEEDGDYLDLSQLLDSSSSDPKQHTSVAALQKKKENEKLKFLIPQKEESEVEDAEQNSLSDEESDDDERDTSNIDLTSIIDSLQQQQSKAKKRKRLEERTESFRESEFMPASSSGLSRKKVVLDDLVGAIDQENTFGELKRQLGTLDKVQTVSVPLAPRIQEKLDRAAAKEETDKSVSKWIPIVKKNREAETLSFPMNQPPVVNLTSGALVGKFEPFTEMEKEINHVLEVSGLSEKKQKELEELELNRLSREEMIEKRAELAKMRSLMFYKEQKQKKIAKIKSKTYRKIAKKAAEKNSEKLGVDELAALDPERAIEERERLEYERAKERITLKHKNTGKWAKKMMGRFDSEGGETHKAVMEQLQKGEELRQRITGYNSEDDSDRSSAPENALEELNALELEMEDDKLEEAPKGVFGMKFMQKEFANQKLQAQESVRRAKREMQFHDHDDESDDDSFEKPKQAGPRHQFAKQASSSADFFNMDDDGSAIGDVSQEFHVKSLVNLPVQPKHVFDVESFGIVETVVEEHKNLHQSKTEAPKISQKVISPVSKKAVDHDTTIKIDVSNTNESPPELTAWFDDSCVGAKKSITQAGQVFEKECKSTKALAKISAIKKKLAPKQPESGGEDEVLLHHQTEEDCNEPLTDQDDFNLGVTMVHSSHYKDLKNSDIMQMAFSSDKISKDFAKEKKDISMEDSGKVVEDVLPGWGDWSGPGISASASKSKKRKITTKPGAVEVGKRKDAKLKNVIINEKRLKKASKYMQPKLPHGFDNREQYERTISNPLGKEWNTENAHKAAVQPKVITKLGAFIEPLKFTK